MGRSVLRSYVSAMVDARDGGCEGRDRPRPVLYRYLVYCVRFISVCATSICSASISAASITGREGR